MLIVAWLTWRAMMRLDARLIKNVRRWNRTNKTQPDKIKTRDKGVDHPNYRLRTHVLINPGRQRMARPACKRIDQDGATGLHQRIRSQG